MRSMLYVAARSARTKGRPSPQLTRLAESFYPTCLTPGPHIYHFAPDVYHGRCKDFVQIQKLGDGSDSEMRKFATNEIPLRQSWV